MFKEKWSQFSTSEFGVYLVDGTEQRLIYPDFTEGGNDCAYNGVRLPFTVPANQAYVELQGDLNEMKCWLLHELHERNIMYGGPCDEAAYSTAHDAANKVEVQGRTDTSKLDEMLMNEVKQLKTNKSSEPMETKEMTGTKVVKIYQATIKQIDELNHRVYAVFNASDRDRDNEQNAPTAWKGRITPYLAHNILVSCHTYDDLRKQIGEVEINMAKIDQSLEGWVSYYVGEGNEEADWGFKLAKRNKAAYSVGYMSFDSEPGDGEKAPRRLFTDNELLEISQVIVPSSRSALTTGKELDPVIAKLFDNLEAEMEPKAKTVHQSEIKDEFDYCLELVKSGNLSAENIVLLDQICRFAGYDKPENIISKSTQTRIRHAMDACKTAMDVMTVHDKAHQAAFETHAKSIIRCYNGLKSMAANEVSDDDHDDTTEVAPSITVMQLSASEVDEIVSRTTAKY